ncbi:MAG: phosphate acyltransferase PlsX [Rhizobiaceae bacterium]|nr:phosphate acyltransferase PlsX [Rhizobiaceae bacterium]MBL4733262.1 phosphate acyltransferase PlsX [Rhizobiaceae bacterium]
MAETLTISLDAMGGDSGPDVVLGGADLALERKPHLRFEIFGIEEDVLPILKALPKLDAASNFHASEIAISMDEKPGKALRKGRFKSSMWQAIAAVKDGTADACVSAGNTGALMAMAKFCLRTQAGVDRPAMAAIWPTLTGESIVLDVGANIGADAGQLIDFAVMGAAMARALNDSERPSVGLLNIGVEEAKGQEDVREAGQILHDSNLSNLHYHGFVEGDDLGKGTVDVVVTEGLSGNIALKTAEGTAKQISGYLKAAMNRTLLARLGYLLAKGAFDQLREKMDPRKVNGAVMLGLNGVVIKSHGGTDAEGFAAAIEMGHDMAAHGLLGKIKADLEQFNQLRSREETGSNT